jgi:hypothetical protein
VHPASVQCYMPGRTYMGIHYRLDHSLRIPRPDLSIRIGTPNACNRCHADKDNQWSVDAVTKWYQTPRSLGTHAPALAPDGLPRLAAASFR